LCFQRYCNETRTNHIKSTILVGPETSIITTHIYEKRVCRSVAADWRRGYEYYQINIKKYRLGIEPIRWRHFPHYGLIHVRVGIILIG